MTARAGRKPSSLLANVLLVAVSVICSIVVAEAAVRIIDDQPLLAFPLPEPIGLSAVNPKVVDQIPRAAGVDRNWFFSDPPPLPNRSKPSEEWQKLFRDLEDHPSGGLLFRPLDIFKVWNSAFAGDPCQHRLLHYAPGQLYVYDPPDHVALPPFRFYPNVTLPSGLVTNQIGWRGKPIVVPRPQKTIRIVFVGASTTVDMHHFPFSHPEFVGHWLDLWAASKHLDVHFEVLNSGRESIDSKDIAQIVRTEVLPLQPDLVVYYEGGNQFRPASIVEKVPEGSAVRPPPKQAVAPQWLGTASRYSALMRRVQAAIGYAASDLDGREWPKPDYKVVWPPGLDEFDPDLNYPKLPVNLNTIEQSLDSIRADLATVGGELALSSFPWMVKDGMVLDPVKSRYILEQLNIANYPFRYRDLERLANFQNRVLAKYAKVHGLTFVDVAKDLPLDPDLYLDAVHQNYAGVRVHGWIVLQYLLPTIEAHLANGSWPKQPRPEPPLPTFEPRHITFNCNSKTQ